MIIDALAHITRDGSWFDTGLNSSLSSLIDAMDKEFVDSAVIAGIPGVADDDLLLDAVKTHPYRFLPVAGIDVSIESKVLMYRLRHVKELGFHGIKIHPRLSNVSLTDERLHNAVQQAGDLDLTVMICTIHRPPLLPLGRPLSDVLYELCLKCSNTRILLVHGGYTDILATSELIRNMEHVMLDLSTTLPRFHGSSIGLDIHFLLDSFDKRICVGTDFPEYDMGHIRKIMGHYGDAEKILNMLSLNLKSMFPNWGKRP